MRKTDSVFESIALVKNFADKPIAIGPAKMAITKSTIMTTAKDSIFLSYTSPIGRI